MTDDDIDPVRVPVEADTRALEAALGGLKGMADDFGRAMTDAFRKSAFEGGKLTDVLREVALGLSGKALGAALQPVERGVAGVLGGALSGLGQARAFAAGGVLSGGGVLPAPTAFPLRGGLGLAGEAGPEAVLPLARGPDGRLGVRAGGGGGSVHVTFNVSTPDAASFRRAEAEMTAMLARAVARGARGL